MSAPFTKRFPMGLRWRLGRELSLALFCLLSLALAGAAQTASPSAPLTPQPPAATGLVLDLDGTNACVVLPSGLITNDVATVEGWFKWRKFGSYSRLFDFYGERVQFGVQNRSTPAFLHFERPERNAAGQITHWTQVQAFGLLAANEWCHVAAVVRTNSTKLFFNGVLVVTEETSEIWPPPTEPDRTNYLGRSALNSQRRTGENPDFDGQMMEIRLWAGERTEAQIRENMFKGLTGREPDLVGLWNFNDPGQPGKDSSPNTHHGTLVGQARLVNAPLPDPSELKLPAILFGKVHDGLGNPVTYATIRVLRQEQEMATTLSRPDGTYSLNLLQSKQAEEVFDVQTCAGDLGAWVSGVSCRGGERKELNFTLASAVSITGKVTAFDGSPIADVIVQAVRADAPPREAGRLATPGLAATTLTTTTNGAQNYRFLNLRPGEYKLRVHVPEGQLEYHRGEVLRVEPGKTLDADFQIAPFRKGRWRRYTTANGLPDNRVYDLHFAPDGTLWLATQAGVSRFDGLKFTSLSERDGLIDNRVFCIYAGREGALWFGTEKGASLFDPATGRFQNFPSGTNGLSAGTVFDMEATPDGLLWLRTRQGLSRFNGQSFQEIPGIPPYFMNPASFPDKALAVDRQGRVWTTSDLGGLWRVQGTNAVEVAEVSRDALLDAIHVAPDGMVWFLDTLTRDGRLARFDGQRLERLAVAESALEHGVPAIHTTPEGIMWLGEETGSVTRFDPVRFTFTRFGGGKDAPSSVVVKIRSGPDGALWFGTKGGLYRYEEETFVNYGKADGLPNDDTFDSAVTTDGSVWFSGPGTYLAHMKPGLAAPGESRFVDARTEGLEKTGVYGLLADANGGLWVGGTPTLSGVYYHASNAVARGEKPFRSPPDTGILNSGYNLGFYIDAQKTLWVGKLDAGLHKFNLDDLWAGKAKDEFVPGVTNLIATTYHDSHGALWMCAMFSSQPISRLKGNEVQYFSMETTGGGLPSDNVRCFQDGADGLLYIGTGAGLARFDGTRFAGLEGTADRPVPRGIVSHILRDRDDVLWFASDSGLFRYDGVTWSSLDEEDGLPSLVVKTIAQGLDGAYWIGTDKGVTCYRPTRQAPAPPQLVVKTDREHNGAEKIPAITSGQLVGFRFNAVDFKTQPLRRFYRCAIVPGRSESPPSKRDAAWREPTLAAQFDWNPKAPGEYTFFVQSIDRDLNYSEPARAFLQIVTPWYANAWIMIPGAFVVAGLFGWAFVARSLVIRRKREAEQLRGQMLEQERQARLTLEAANKQLVEAKEAADAASTAKSQFLANMSHELRTPLNAIIGYSEMLQEEVADLGQEGLRPDLEKIHGAGKHLLGLINDILDLSKIEAGKMTLYLEEFDVAQMLREVATTVQPLVAKNANQLNLTCPPDIGRMRADLTKVRQTLFNLLSNACKFTEKGVITLQVDRGARPSLSRRSVVETDRSQFDASPAPYLTFIVSDSGIGITPQQMSRLFEAFAQADASTTRKYGGTGLGLAISRNFCRMMGGDLVVASEPGQGSIFTVTLPVEVKEPASPAEARATRAAPVPGLPTPHSTVLVIDDEAIARDLIERALLKEGFHVELAADGRSGLEQARKLKPQAITLDVMMPGMDGWAVLTALKADPSTADIPVIMLTVVDEKQIGFALGAAGYFTKPIDWGRLNSVLQKFRKPANHQTVLIVEDDQQARDMLRRALTKDGWQVLEAGNGRLALERLNGLVPALILLDLMMPEMDGFEFMQQLRQRPDCRRVPVVVITAKDITDDDRRRLNGNVARILRKSTLSLQELVTEVRALTRGP
jgi:signal transduction histidine kinase/CheY-like chemotaxis protein/ligand-binding sensor domain-containing protein